MKQNITRHFRFAVKSQVALRIKNNVFIYLKESVWESTPALQFPPGPTQLFRDQSYLNLLP